MLSKDGFKMHLNNIESQSKWTEYYKDAPELAEVSQKSVDSSKQVLIKFFEEKPKEWLEDRTFLVVIEGEDPIVVAVKDDVNRPNNMDCHSVLEEWKTDNYGYRKYDYWEIDTCEKHNI